jgi:cytochrome b561
MQIETKLDFSLSFALQFLCIRYLNYSNLIATTQCNCDGEFVSWLSSGLEIHIYFESYFIFISGLHVAAATTHSAQVFMQIYRSQN